MAAASATVTPPISRKDSPDSSTTGSRIVTRRAALASPIAGSSVKREMGEQHQELHSSLAPSHSSSSHPRKISPPSNGATMIATSNGGAAGGVDEIWLTMREEARRDAEAEPALASYLYSTILAHRSLERALAFHLGNKLSSSTLLSTQLFTMFVDTFMEDAEMRETIRADIAAVRERDPACVSFSHCMLNFKGFLACQAHRVSHRLWNQGRQSLALALQSRVSEVFHVDIHPAAKIGRGVLFDHATGLVVGETATIGNNVSILHNVTLGGTGAMGGDRHPKICDGVLIGAGAIILGPVRIGEGAKIGAGSVVLIEVPPHTTAVGNPARLVGGKLKPTKLKDIPSETMDHTSFISSWSDYVI
ncbi:serine acetyltransferase 5 isoform X1 [Selaginella moellendorffii]|nr:serine acetyltransferase 5 isoform X1 [Selaginella moellendorffii]|eukprot:XP_002974520.2 serine acetyltransferase 5 isoform X1 [Selaginella moellendorffii]